MSSGYDFEQDNPVALVGHAFSQAIEAHKRLEYVRDELRRGDQFAAGEDVKLALDALDDVKHDLSGLQALLDPESTVASHDEHCRCPDCSPDEWNDENVILAAGRDGW